MELWVVFAVAAAATQALRTAVQRRMTPTLGNLGASYIRFSYAFPLAWLFLYIYISSTGAAVAELPTGFWFWINLAALHRLFSQFYWASFLVTGHSLPLLPFRKPRFCKPPFLRR